ncbi:MAG: hypothetical protein IJ125_05360 [Atopobiaceae bacterium]|nr:hypothetical protein [Atopobiaceae bacterium]
MKRDKDYSAWITELKNRYRQSQVKASVAVNTELLTFYWQLGRDIVLRDVENKYGSGFYKTLSNDITDNIPNAKGFSPRSLQYMRRFYELVPIVDESLPQPVAESVITSERRNLLQLAANSQTITQPNASEPLFAIPWGHIRMLIDKCRGDSDKALFYARKTLENNWSRAMLGNFIETSLYERQGKAVSNFISTLPAPQGDLGKR